MNSSYYGNHSFPGNPLYNGNTNILNNQDMRAYDAIVEPYMESLLKANKGKMVKVYMSFPQITNYKEFSGILEGIGKDYIILSEPSTGNWNILPMMYIDYISFEEKINYNSNT